MSKSTNISSYDLSLLRKFVTKTLNNQENDLFNTFLESNPEYKEILTLTDLEKIEMVSTKSVSIVNKKINGVIRKVMYVVLAAAAVLVVIGLLFNPPETVQGKDVAVQEDSNHSEHSELVALDSSVVSSESYHKEISVDTFYYVNTDDVQPEVAIEYIEENKKEQIKPIAKVILAEADSVDTEKIKVVDKDVPFKKEKTFGFIAELDYRQSVAVESYYAQAYKVGQTKSFAGEIGGYEFNPEGMPQFGDDESAFYNFLEKELSTDTLLTKINKKMEAKVSFEVNHKGKVEHVSVVKCNHKQLCMKLTDIFENIPDWQPADFKGKKGSVHYVIQVNYE